MLAAVPHIGYNPPPIAEGVEEGAEKTYVIPPEIIDILRGSPDNLYDRYRPIPLSSLKASVTDRLTSQNCVGHALLIALSGLGAGIILGILVKLWIGGIVLGATVGLLLITYKMHTILYNSYIENHAQEVKKFLEELHKNLKNSENAPDWISLRDLFVRQSVRNPLLLGDSTSTTDSSATYTYGDLTP